MLLINAIGYSDSGKTTLLEAITRHYFAQGKRVAVIKDIHSEKFQPEPEGKDTWRYTQAGAHLVVARGTQDTVFHWRSSLKFLEIIGKVTADVLVVEGFKDEQMPRIVCAGEEKQLTKLIDSQTICISGKISDQMEEYQKIPVYSASRDLPKIIALIEKKSARWD